MLKWVNGILGVVLGLYLAYGAYYYVAQDGMIFPADKAEIPVGLADDYPNRYEFWIPTDDGPVEAWYLPPTHLDAAPDKQTGDDPSTSDAPGIHTGDDTPNSDAPGNPTGDAGTGVDSGNASSSDKPRSEDRGQRPPTNSDPHADRRAVPIPTWVSADTLPAWAPAALMVVAHGNADVIDDWLPRVDLVRTAGIGVLLVEYPGYGRSPGDPGQDIITALQIAGLDSVLARGWVNPERMVYTGHSLGGGVACQLASYIPPQALILISTFTSLRPFAADYFLPGFLVAHPFDNLAVIQQYEGEVLVVHAEDDETVPYDHGKTLYEAAPGGWFASRDRGGHDTLEGAWTVFWSTTGLPFLADTWRVGDSSGP